MGKIRKDGSKLVIRAMVRSVVYLLSFFLGKRLSLAFWGQLVAGVQDATSNFVTYHFRPKCADAIHTPSHLVNHLPSLAIVIQGPVINKDAFTLETAKLYKQNFPTALLILSTWNDHSPEVLQPFDSLGVQVLLNSKPDYAGVSNINLQIVSSRAGIQKAREMGVEYALKTRTDQRMYAPDIAAYLHSITQVFPVGDGWGKQRKRIVGCSLNTFKYRMYGLSDMLIYGHIEDMWLYWNVDLDDRVFTEQDEHEAGASLKKFARWRVCEVYLATEFLSKLGRALDWTLRDSWTAFAEHFCVVDKEQLDLYWNKYNQREYRWLFYCGLHKFQELTFRDWINLYGNQNKIVAPEEILDGLQ